MARHSLVYDEDKMSKGIAKQALEIASKHAKKLNIEVLDAEYVKEGNERYLRVYLYKPEGISIDDCELVHRAIDKEIRVNFPLPPSRWGRFIMTRARRTTGRSSTSI